MALADRHPEAERLAEYADGVLAPGDRSEVERHLADCADCRAVVAETIAFLQTQSGALGGRSNVIPFRLRWRVTAFLGGIAAAAALVLGVRLARPDWIMTVLRLNHETTLQELVAAGGGELTRPVEGRLAGGFPYAPPPVTPRGPAELAGMPVKLQAAVAAADEAGHANGTLRQLAASGTAMLFRSDLEHAIADLVAACQGRPVHAVCEANLAAAYIERARRSGNLEDLDRAISAANRALAAQPEMPEALFNRALAAETRKAPEAIADWKRYLAVDGGSPWSAEAQRHLDQLQSKPQGVRGPNNRDVIALQPVGALQGRPGSPDSLFKSNVLGFSPSSIDSNSQILIENGTTLVVSRRPNDFPASFWFATDKTVCSASVIGPNLVLLAAHCFEHASASVVLPIGGRQFTGECERAPEFSDSDSSLRYDLAACKLEHEIPPGTLEFETISTAASVQQNEPLVITGFGCDGNNSDKVFRGGFVRVERTPTADDDHLTLSGLSGLCLKPDGTTQMCPNTSTVLLCERDSGGATYKSDNVVKRGRTIVGVNSYVFNGKSAATSLSTERARKFLDGWRAKGARICGMDAVAGCRPGSD